MCFNFYCFLIYSYTHSQNSWKSRTDTKCWSKLYFYWYFQTKNHELIWAILYLCKKWVIHWIQLTHTHMSPVFQYFTWSYFSLIQSVFLFYLICTPFIVHRRVWPQPSLCDAFLLAANSILKRYSCWAMILIRCNATKSTSFLLLLFNNLFPIKRK